MLKQADRSADGRRRIPGRIRRVVWCMAWVSALTAARAQTSVTIVAGGDILLDRGVRTRLTENTDPGALLQPIAAILREADLAMANLECALVDSGTPIYKVHMFRGDPSMASVLAGAGLDILSLANNHAYDYGRAALLETQAHLVRAGIRSVGAGPDATASFEPVFLEVNSMRLAVLGYVDLVLEGLPPEQDAPGPAHGDRARLIAAVRAAAQEADFVIVQIHWGSEYAVYPSEDQRQLARALVAAGADLILGHHPHVIQPVQWVDNALVFYSLGNLIFDGGRPGSDEAILARVVLSLDDPVGSARTDMPDPDARVTAVEVLPLWIDDCRPLPAPAERVERIVGRVDPSGTLVCPSAAGAWRGLKCPVAHRASGKIPPSSSQITAYGCGS
jgi:hypothetical protein